MTTQQPPLPFDFFPPVPSFEFTSNDISEGAMLGNDQVADVMGYTGTNRSPHLSWSGFPANALSFAVTMFDPDAPTGSGFWHWVVFDIPREVSELAAGAGASDLLSLPTGARQVRNDAGTVGYFGAAPPKGDTPHRYVHTVHALDIAALEVGKNASPAYVGFNLRFHAVARAEIVAVFGS